MIAGYRRFWSGYMRHHWRLLLIVVALMVVVAAVSAGYAKFVQILIERIEARDIGFLYLSPILVIALTSLKGIAYYFQLVLGARVFSRAEADMQGVMYRRLIHTDLAHLQSEAPAATAARFSSDVSSIAAAVQSIFNGMSYALIVVGTFIAMLSINTSMTMGLIVIFLLVIWPVHWIGQHVRRVAHRVQAQIAGMTADVNEGIAKIRLVRSYGLETRVVGTAERVFDRLRAEKLRLKRWNATLEPVMEINGGLALAGLLLLVAWQMSADRGSLADFIGLLTGLAVASTPARRLGSTYTAAQKGAAALDRVHSILDREDAIKNAPDAQGIGKAMGKIEFADVSFSYPDGTPALDALSLKIEPGQKVAFVGRSGAGKSTVFNLLPRLFEATSGEVRLDDIPVENLILKELRDQIGVVSQDSVLMSGTIAENIGFGRAEATRAEIIEAAKAAQAHEFIDALPDGYDTLIAPGGGSFSGGERQRLSIARAVLRDAPILMLDEPTSALDAKSEAAIRLALNTLSAGRTTLVIAHRLSTIRDADVIIVMEQGRVVDQGSHDELLARKGLYAELNSLQFGDSRD